MGLLREALPAFPYELGCSALIVGSFADEGPWAPRTWLDVPRPPAGSDCASAEPPAQTGATGILVQMLGFRERFQREAQEACRREREAARRRFERERAAFVAAAGEAIAEPQLREETRTDIVGLLESLIDTRVALSLLVTDGIDTSGREVPELTQGDGARVVLILLPAGERYGGRNAVGEAARRWQRAGARAVPYTMLVAPSAWEQLSREGRER